MHMVNEMVLPQDFILQETFAYGVPLPKYIPNMVILGGAYNQKRARSIPTLHKGESLERWR